MLSFSSAKYIVASTQAENPHDKNAQNISRPLAKFPEKLSVARYSSFTVDKQLHERYAKEIEPLKEEVRKQIVDTEINTAKKLNLIDITERLGISYHFKEEIEEQLDLIHSGNRSSDNYSDLGTVALQFRLFRQHGFDISSDIFDQFTKKNGKFQESLRNDIKSLLNLYEASNVRTHHDSILEEALIFTRSHLSTQMEHSCPSIHKQVKRALQQPLHKGIPRIEAQHFISAYSFDKFKDASLLRLAKLDYNLLQNMYKEELSTLLRWWKEKDLASKVPYARDRIIAFYLYSRATGFEPHYSMLRILLTKLFAAGVYVDDTYDAYCTLDELDLFTAAMQRWDITDIDRLPEYVRSAFRAFMEVHEEFQQFAVRQGRPYAFQYVKETWKEYARYSNVQSKWFLGGELPPFSDYMKVGWITAGQNVTIAMCFLAMESVTEDLFHFLSTHPPMVVCLGKTLRLQNDLAGHKFDKKRSAATSIDIYMKDYKVSEEEAKHKFKEMYENCWKDFNEEYSRKAEEPLTRDIFDIFINQMRIMDAAYKTDEDMLTDEQKFTGPMIQHLLMEPFDV